MRKWLGGLRLVGASYRVLRDPKRLDDVIMIADQLSRPEVVEQMLQAVSRDPVGAQALVQRPRVRVDLEQLGRMPEGTLGREFADHMRRAGLDPSDLPSRPAHDAGSFLRAHLFETHDIWHVVTGFGVDEAGELGLQAFYLAQLPARLSPLLIAIGMTHTFLYAFDQHERRMEEIARGWQLGRKARKLFGIDWNAHWHVPLAQLRSELALAA